MAFLRLRDLPGGENIVAYIANGAQVTVYETATDKIGREWHHVLFEQNMPHLFQDEALTQPFTNYVRGYVYGPFVKFPGAHPDPVFTVDRTAITAGESVTLAWNAPGASALRINGKGVTGPANTLVSTPDKTMTYTFVASYDGERDVAIAYTVTVKPAPVPPAPAGHFLGVNVIHECDDAKALSGKGCKAFLIIDHPDVCEQIKAAHPDAIVVNRRWSRDPLDGKQWWDKFGASYGDTINEIFNEQDGNHDYGTPQALRLRIDQEMQYYQIARSRGAKVALGAFSRGCPEFAPDNPNTPGIIEQLRRYAPLYNTDPGCYLSLHNYSPDMRHIDNAPDWIWIERRWKFFFTQCGFDPTLRKIIVTETGVDEGGIGGFPAHKATAEQFVHWCKVYQDCITRPLLVNGASYPSPVIASMLYCFTRGKEWAGFDIAQWENELAQVAGW